MNAQTDTTARETLEQLMDRAEVMLMSRSYPPNEENLAADLDERTQLGYDLLAALRAAPAPTDVQPEPTLCNRRGPGWQCVRGRNHAGRCETITVRDHAPAPELPDEFEADGVNYCGHCYQAIEQTPSELLAAALASDEPEATPAPFDAMVKLAKEATNGWACYARTKAEHAEIARLHSEINKFRASPSQTQAERELMTLAHGDRLLPDASGNAQIIAARIHKLRAAPAPTDVVEDLVVALRSLAYAAMTSGGTKGPDAALKDAIRWATDALQKYDKLRAAPAPEGETPTPRCVVCRTEYPTTGQQAGPVAGVWGKNFMVCKWCVDAGRDAKRESRPTPDPENA
jgi:hypothetical protein